MTVAAPTSQHLFKAASEVFGVTIKELKSRSRGRRVVIPRQAIMWLARDYGYSWQQIGLFLARDHTTVINGHRRISALRERPNTVRVIADGHLLSVEEALLLFKGRVRSFEVSTCDGGTEPHKRRKRVSENRPDLWRDFLAEYPQFEAFKPLPQAGLAS